VVQDREKWLLIVNTMKNIRAPLNARWWRGEGEGEGEEIA